MNVLLKGREVSVLPRGSGREGADRLARLRRGGAGGRERAAVETFVVTPGEFEQQFAEAEPARETVDRDETTPR